MEINSKEIAKTLNPNKVWIPILIGVAIVAYLFLSDPDVTADKLKLIFDARWIPLMLAFLVILARDSGYVYRIKVLTNHELNWESSIYVIILWEFASAITPSVVGGTTIVVLVLMKEGIKFGKALAYVMLTSILDNSFFLLMSPIALIYSKDELFPQTADMSLPLGNSLQVVFLISYSLIAIYTIVMIYALLIRPRGFKWFLMKLSSIRFLRRWRYAMSDHGDEVILASRQLRGKQARYWITIIAFTFFVWCARYAMLNCLVASFVELTWSTHCLSSAATS